MAIGVTIIGICCAIFFPITNITTFLYFIGSVFAPMFAIQIVDYFVGNPVPAMAILMLLCILIIMGEVFVLH